jgi:Zn-dependent protease
LDLNALLPVIITVAIMLLVGFPVHEFSHALAAYRLGDGTAKLFGRLSLNPIVHFDPIGGSLLALTFLVSNGTFGFGWAKPTPVNPSNLEGGHRGEAIVAAAGPISNLVMSIVVALPFRYILGSPELVTQVPLIVLQVMSMFIYINLILMVFNLIPIPPLDGSKVLFAFLPPRALWQWRPILEQYGFIVLIIVFFLPITPQGAIGGVILVPVLDALYGLLVGV